VTGNVSADRAADPRGGPDPVTQTGGGRGRWRRWLVVLVVLVVVAGSVAGAALAGAFDGSGSPGGGGGGYGTQTAAVQRQTLTQQITVSATLGYTGSYTVTGKGGGVAGHDGAATLTWLPNQGRVISQGGVLYRVNNHRPVFLLYGNVPAWRALAKGMKGRDVSQLNHDLVTLGYGNRADIAALGWDYFSWDTRYALKRLKARLGIEGAVGNLPLGSAVFEPSALRVTTVSASLGGAATGPIFTATGARQQVTIDLDTSESGEVKAGDTVSIALPNGTNTPGVITSIGKVATTNSSGSTTVTVEVRLKHQRAASGLNSAPVNVTITTISVRGVLVVPVGALLAQPGGGWAVEVAGPHGHHLVRVTTGLFDSAAGKVQVSGAGLAAGQRVVVSSA
jgi:HlyD family secretion protein